MAGPPPNPRLGSPAAKAPDANMPNKNYSPFGGRPKFGQKEDMRRKAGKKVVEKARKGYKTEAYKKTGGTAYPSEIGPV